VNVLGANGASASSPIESDGSYSVDVSLLTAPFILYAEGRVNGKGLTMYSAAIAAGTVNITAYANWTSSQVSATDLIAAETNVQQQIEPVLNALGIDSNVDLISTPFSADLTGIDMALEVLTIDYSGTVATVTNNITGSSFTDDFTDVADNVNTLPVSDFSNENITLTDQYAINKIWQLLVDLYATTRPTALQMDTFAPYVQLLDGFVNYDEGPNVGFSLNVVIDRELDVSETAYTKGYWVRFYYSDSEISDSFLTTMVYDGSKWLFYGDRTWVKTGARAHASMNVFGSYPTNFQTGYAFYINDNVNYAYNQGVRSAIVTGPSLPASGVIFEHLFPETQFGIYLDQNNGNFYTIIDDDALSAIQDNAEYTFTFCPESAAELYDGTATCNALQTYTDTVMKRPVLNADINASMFVSLTEPASHNVSDMNFGGLININWTVPVNTRSGGVFLGWRASGVQYQAFADPLPGETSATLDTIGLPAPGAGEWSSIFIRVTDEYDREFNMGWTFD